MGTGVHRFFLAGLFLIGGFPGRSLGEVLVLQSGSTATGTFLSVDERQFHFRSVDKRVLDVAREEVFGVFADEAPKKTTKPSADAKSEIRFRSTSLSGAVIWYDPKHAFLFYASSGKPKVALLRPDEKLLYLKLGKKESLEKVDLGVSLGKEVAKAMKTLLKDDRTILASIQLGERFLKMAPSGKGMEEVENLLGSVRKTWKEKAKDFFKLTSVATGARSDNQKPLLTYRLQSVLDSFEDLDCQVWLQLSTDQRYSAHFSYFTLRKTNQHLDTVEAEAPGVKIKKWRIVLSFYGEVVATKESEPAGPAGWWEGISTKLTFWGTEDGDPQTPDSYFSATLGKRVSEKD